MDLSYGCARIASMLSVDDVCDWVVHSLHMPEEVREIMRANAVTGYDFPDLVEHDGRLIETELGITKRTLRSRLYRGLVMRLMGMGTLPSDMINVNTDSVSCHEVRLQWVVEQGGGRHGFPTHKYLVQRYETTDAVSAEATATENLSPADPLDIDAAFAANTPISLPGGGKSRIQVPEWTVVCSDMSTFCIDKGLAPGTKYMYRVSAWNAVRVLYRTIDILKIIVDCMLCSLISFSLTSILCFAVQIGRSEYFYVQATTRANCTFLDPLPSDNTIRPIASTEAALSLQDIYQQVIQLISWVFYLAFGIIASCFLLETVHRLVVSCDQLQQTQFGLHKVYDQDDAAKRVIRIFGFSILLSDNFAYMVTTARTWMLEHVLQHGMVLLPQSFISTLEAIAVATHKDPHNPTGELRSPIKHLMPPLRDRRLYKACSASALSTGDDVSVSTSASSVDSKRCYLCSKKFSYVLKAKHYCGRCNRNFCRRCAGHIDHVWPTPCKINSRCVCKNCQHG